MRFGGHVSTSGGIDSAIERARAIGAESIQVFTQSPRMWRPTAHAPERLAAFRAGLAEHGLGPAVCHALYFINLASQDDDIYGKSVAALSTTCEVATAIGAEGVVFHVGSHKGAGLDATLPRIVAGIEAALAACGDGVSLLLENSAGAGDTIGRDLDELARVLAAVDDPRVGLCVDTCHIFVSGVDLRDAGVVDRLVEDIDGAFGLERLRCLHVNDSAAPLGSNRDRHAPLGEGEIGAALGLVLSHPRLQGLPAILETPGPGKQGDGPDADELAKARALHAAGVAARG